MGNPIAEVRLLCPRRALPAWEARGVAERQAYRLHRLVAVSEPPFPEQAIEYLPRLAVRYASTRRLAGGLRWTGRTWCIVVNRDDTWGRQRFSLAHELKHLIDHPMCQAIYRSSRFGSADYQAVAAEFVGPAQSASSGRYRHREAARCRRSVDDLRGRRRQLIADHLANPKAIPLDGAELTDEFGALLAEDLVAQLDKLKAKPRAFRAQGSTFERLVETAGRSTN